MEGRVILEKPKVVGFVDLSKFDKYKKRNIEILKEKEQSEQKILSFSPSSSKRKEPNYLINADPLFQTVGSIIKEHFGGITVQPDGTLQARKNAKG